LSKHTAFPWHLCEPYQGCDGREVVGAIFGDDDGEAMNMIGEFERREDAAFAVHAAHCHDDLLAACKAALGEFRSIRPHITANDIEGCISGRVLDRLEIAILKAEGTPE
jgi:hypothetical protein